MRRKLSLLAILLSTLLSKYSFGQGNTNYLQNFTAPTANGYAFSKIDNVQISPFSGKLNFSIPLCSKKLSMLGCNVSLAYTGGGGINVYDPGSIVTKGWQLNNGGGAIIRYLRGIPDDYKNDTLINGYVDTKYNGMMYNNGNLAVKSDGDGRITATDFTSHYDEGDADSQHDIFEFSFSGQSGKFYIGKDKQVIVVPQSKLKVDINFDATGHKGSQIGSFTITDENGIKYYFSSIETVSNNGNQYKTSSDTSYNYAKTFYGKEYVTLWMLSKIEAPFGEENIKFNYEPDEFEWYYSPFNNEDNTYYIYTKKNTDGSTTTYNNTLYQGSFTHLRIKSVSFSDRTQILFSYQKPGSAIPGDNDHLVRKIILTDSSGNFSDGYQLNYIWGDSTNWQYSESYIWQSINAFKVDTHLYSVNKLSSSDSLLPYCAFTYNLVSGKNEEAYSGKLGIDYWGYHTGRDNFYSRLNLLSGFPGGISDRSPVLDYARVGTLKSIVYGSGGSEEFEYELNDKKVSGSNTTVGGVRLKSRTLHDGISPLHDIRKEYKYIGTDGLSSGFGEDLVFLYNYYGYYDNGGWPGSLSLKYTTTYCMSHPVNPANMIEGSPVTYSRVEELIKNGTSYNGKTVYEYSDVSYSPYWPAQESFPYRPMDRATWAVGLPLATSVYSAAGTLVKKTVNDWNIYASQIVNENYRSLYMGKKAEVDKGSSSPQPTLLPTIYKFSNFYPVNGRVELARTREYTYPTIAGQPEALVTTRYTYDTASYVLRSAITYQANGDSIETIQRYPFDYSFSDTNHVINRMIKANIRRAAVSSEVWVNNTARYLATSTVTEYGFVNGSQIRPINVYRSSFKGLLPQATAGSFVPTTLLQASHNMKQEVSYPSYDAAGRAVTITKIGGVQSAVIIDSSYNIIAKADNATSDKIAYSSFEDKSKGNWSYDTSGIVTTEGRTGGRSYNGTITKTGLASDNYLVTLWAKGSGNITVNGSNQAISSSWQPYEWKLTSATSVTIATNGNKVDEVRLHPQTALMTTVTFKNAAQLVAQNSVNAQSTFYAYDVFNRLHTTRDNDNNIIRTSQYSYKAPYASTAQSGSFTPGCPDHYVPAGNITYNVAAGKYTSLISTADATAKAVHDLNTLGYFYATDHGTCLPLYYNSEISRTYTKNTCPNDYYSPGGTNVVYTVGANKYSTPVSQAAADAMAAADTVANGQAYANANGVCLWRMNVDVESWGYDGQIIFEKTLYDPDPLVFDIGTGPSYTQDVVVPMGTYARVMVVTNSVGGGYCRVHMGSYTPWDVYFYGSTAIFTNVWIYDWYYDSNDILISPF